MEKLATHSENPGALRQELLGSFNQFETSFRKRFPLIWWVTLIGPILITIALLVYFGLTAGWGYPEKLIYHAFLTTVVLGRFVILYGMEGVPMKSRCSRSQWCSACQPDWKRTDVGVCQTD